jgi:hypothetical protein
LALSQSARDPIQPLAENSQMQGASGSPSRTGIPPRRDIDKLILRHTDSDLGRELESVNDMTKAVSSANLYQESRASFELFDQLGRETIIPA